MIRHIVLINWKANTTQEQIDAVTASLNKLPDLIPQIKNYHFGADKKIYPTNADYALVADFDSIEDFTSYSVHEDHINIMQSVTADIMESYFTAQISIDD